MTLPPELVICDEDRARARYVESDLLPCPFCGKRPLSVGEVNPQTGNFVARIICSDCTLSLSVCKKSNQQEQARKEVKAKWNSRVNPAIPL
jgi:Lar family restriction alleviation protein